jgi:lipopolysaccharide export system permease protein
MKIIDKYIIKQYLTTFVVMFGLFIPIGIMVDFAEKIDKFRENEVPGDLIISYYIDFIWYFRKSTLSCIPFFSSDILYIKIS